MTSERYTAPKISWDQATRFCALKEASPDGIEGARPQEEEVEKKDELTSFLVFSSSSFWEQMDTP